MRPAKSESEILVDLGAAVSIRVAQDSHMPGARLGEKHVTVRRHGKPSGILQPIGENINREALWRMRQPITSRYDRLGWVSDAGRCIRRRQVARLDLDPRACGLVLSRG